MPFADLREWLSALEKAGELQRVTTEVDWNLEAGAIVRRVCETDGPAVLFEKIKDYPAGFRILGAPMAQSRCHRYARLAIALDLPPESSVQEITESYLRRRKNLIPPVLVSSAPCQENLLEGAEIDLLKFPVPLIHGGDGGRYIGSWHTVISKDPESGWVNYGMYRLMVLGKNRLGGLVGPIQDFYRHLSAYKRLGRRMEFAVAIGTEPVTAMMSCVSVQGKKSEAEVIGGLRGKPLELARCKTVDLEAPATAEIVLEGFINPDETEEEGPFGEYTGYVGGRQPRPVFHVTAVAHRKDPILTMTSIGVPVDEDHVVMPISNAAEVLEEVRDRKGYPVNFIYVPPESAMHFWVVSTKVPDKSYPRRLAMAIWSTKSGRYANYLLLVNEDVDITDLGSVVWALATRVHPVRDVWQVPHAYTSILVPFLSAEEKKSGDGAYMLLDGTWPAELSADEVPKVSSFNRLWPEEIRKKVLARWSEYGFER
ncbi:MAG: UbiD family decarboxylase [Deltaproteobacteria bacterium]|nr:UbiD family decarboxylase [Deltaproteobacteria bacterium]